MRTLFFIILITVELLAGYYVKPTASGNGSGDSWANADDWDDDFSGSVAAGDTIFMDGGTTSQTYNGKSMFESGTAGNYIYFMAGKYSPDPTNHSGEVIITNSGGAGLSNTGYDYLYFKGISIKNGSSHGTYFYGGSNYIVFDSLVVENNRGVGFWSEESSYHDIKNCVVISHTTEAAQDNDNILYQKNAHHIYIHHNYLRMRNMQTADNHIDNIQFANYPNSVFIYNNICIVDSGNQGHNFILGVCATVSEYHDTVLVFNNYLYNGGYGSGTGFAYYSDNIYNREAEGGTGLNPLAYTINNTLVSANCGIFSTRDGGRTAFASNNIMLKLGQNGVEPPTLPQVHMALSTEPVDSFKTNLYYQVWDGGMSYSTGGGALDWTDWTTAGGDGINDDPDMVNDLTYYDASTNPEPFEIASTSPAIDAGTNMSYILQAFTYLPDFDYTTDILGNPRDANWDIGAFEFQTGAVDSIPVFSFIAQTGKELNTEYIATSAITGVDTVCHFWTTTSAEFKINYNGTYSTAMKTADPDNGADTIYVKNTTGGSYSTVYTETIVGGGHSEDFDVTTKADPAETIIIRILPGNR